MKAPILKRKLAFVGGQIASPGKHRNPPVARGATTGTGSAAERWRYADVGKRDLRFDLLRGFAVFAMVVDHLAGNSWLYRVSGGNRFFVSAAEGFVFISGVIVGIVYGGVARAHGLRAAIMKLLQRAWLLYVLSVWLAIGTALTASILGNPVGQWFAQDPARFIFEVITLRRTFYLVDVLLLYLFAMLAATGALTLLHHGKWWLVALASGALWGAYQVAPDTVQIPWPIANNPVFPFAAWQIVFFGGLILGYHRERIAAWVRTHMPASPLHDGYVLPLGAAFGLLVWLSGTNAAVFNRFAPNGDAAAVLDRWFLKSQLPLPRLLAACIVFGFAWALVTQYWRPVLHAFGPFLLVFGQGALYAYSAHLFLAALVQFAVVKVYGPGPTGGYPVVPPEVNTLLQTGGLMLLWYLTRVRFLQRLVAPLGTLPVMPSNLRIAGRAIVRPAEPLLILLLVALVTMTSVLPMSVARATDPTTAATGAATPIALAQAIAGNSGGAVSTTAGSSATNPARATVVTPSDPAGPASNAGNQADAPPDSTVIAPRSVAGPATGKRDEPPPDSTVIAPRSVAGPASQAANQADVPPDSTVTVPRRVAGPAANNPSAPPAAATPIAPPAATAVPTPPSANSGQTTGAQAAAAAAVSTPTPTAAPTPAGYLLDGQFFSAALGRTMPYGIYLPPGYDTSATRYPVLYMLHGTGGHYSEWVGYGLAETAERLITAGQITPMIIVFPQGDKSYFVNHSGTDHERWGDYIAIDLVAHIDATYRTIPSRAARAIGGLSMGGFAALSLGFTHPDIYVAVGAHSPSLRTFEEAPPSLAATSEEYALINPMVLAGQIDPAVAPKVWIDVGNEDIWIDRTTYVKDLLRKRGLHPEYSENTGGHGGPYWHEYADRYLQFYSGAFTPKQAP